MNSLVKSLIQPILEENQGGIALVPGGFKPPTLGHFSLVDEVAKHPEVNKVLVLIGHKTRDGVTKDESKEIWDIYQKYLPSNVEIKLADNSSPISDVGSLIKNNPDTMFYPVVGIRGEMDLGDLKRFDSMKGKYENFKPIVIKSEGEDRISGTNTRAALIGGEKDRFLTYLPTELSDEDKENVWNILTKTPIDESVIGDKIKNFFNNFKAAYKGQKEDLKGFGPLSKKYLSKEPLTPEEKTKLDRNFKDILKMSGLAVTFPIIGVTGSSLLRFLISKISKGNVDIFPSAFSKKVISELIIKYDLQEMYAEPSEHDYPKLVKSLTEYMVDKGMNIRPLPKVRFVKDDIENARNFFGKTAYYDPNNRLIVLYTMERHPKDVMRSFAHEMIHHMQNCEDRLGNITTQNTNEEGDLPEIEREAYEKGNMTFRNWTDTLTEGVLGDRIECDNCDWSWPIKDGGNDLYVCHKCGHDNTPKRLNEGRYDKITNMASSAIFNKWKQDYESGADASRYEETFETDDLSIDIDANISFIPGSGKPVTDGGADAETGYIEVRFEVDPERLPESWSEISMNLKDVIRHEIEHLTHGEGYNENPAKLMPDDQFIRDMITADLLPKAAYFKLEKEIDANLQGMYLRAKKEKRPFREVIDDYLDDQDITSKEKEEILDLWRTRLSALNLPKF